MVLFAVLTNNLPFTFNTARVLTGFAHIFEEVLTKPLVVGDQPDKNYERLCVSRLQQDCSVSVWTQLVIRRAAFRHVFNFQFASFYSPEFCLGFCEKLTLGQPEPISFVKLISISEYRTPMFQWLKTFNKVQTPQITQKATKTRWLCFDSPLSSSCLVVRPQSAHS